MGLFEKFFEPGYMVLNDFDKNYEFNKRKMKEYLDKFRKDNQKFIYCITDEFEDAVNQWKIDKVYLKNISGSEFFSRYIAIMIQNMIMLVQYHLTAYLMILKGFINTCLISSVKASVLRMKSMT